MHIKNILISIAIIVLTALVVGYGIETFYPSPDMEEYCDYSQPYQEINDSTQCEASGGQWNSNYGPKTVPATPVGYCNMYYTCQQEFENDSKVYSRNLFIITTIIGVILIAIGAILFNLESVGAGIMGGGIVTLIYGAIRHWPNADNLFKFIISLIGLILVIFLGYWLNKRLHQTTERNIFKKKK